MNNQQLTMLRRRVDRMRKNVAGIARAADAALAELNAISDILNDEVGRNLWPSDEPKSRNGKATKPVTEADVLDILSRVFGVDTRAAEVEASKQRHPTARTKR
jgi:hypothetical protein